MILLYSYESYCQFASPAQKKARRFHRPMKVDIPMNISTTGWQPYFPIPVKPQPNDAPSKEGRPPERAKPQDQKRLPNIGSLSKIFLISVLLR